MSEEILIAPALLKQLVFRALDNAKENGYADLVDNGTPEDVALDILAYDDEIYEATVFHETLTPAVMDLIPLIEEWRAK